MDNLEESGFGIAAMILGITGLLFACCFGLGLPLSILGILFGAIGLTQKNRKHGTAIAGLTCSIISIPFEFIMIFFVLIPYILSLD